MSDVGNLTATLTLDTSEFQNGINDANQDIDSATKQTSLFADMLGANLVTKAIGLAVEGLQRLGNAAANTFKEAVTGYAEYEQLIGGVETLFKDSAGVVEEYANQAFETAGLSANQYMSTVTSFSASLIQSLGGDTAQAAEMANMAITDMADNANKMGSSMESIENAYQGFAKQNYTMLDNLKLGYGGTQAEMYRLMSDAAELDAKFAETANFALDSSGHLTASYADMVQAIHIVQTEMGITGTTAKEADNTISGSIASLKAAWSNLVAGLGKDNADIEKMVDDLFTKAKNAWDQLKPVVERILKNAIDAIKSSFPSFLELGKDIAGWILEGIAKAILAIVVTPVAWLLKLFGLSDTGVFGTTRTNYTAYGYRASGGPVQAGVPYVTGELGPELFIPATNGYILNHEDTQDYLSGAGGITININGDVYDDERSLRQKMQSAVLGIIQEQVAYA